MFIDSGLTHNFIKEKVACRLQLPVMPTELFSVKVANGRPMRSQGRFDGVPMRVQVISFSFTLFSLPLMGLDVVLGVHWLESLSLVACDWKEMTMDFQWLNQWRQLRGLDALPIRPITPGEIDKDAANKHSLYAVCLLLGVKGDTAAARP